MVLGRVLALVALAALAACNQSLFSNSGDDTTGGDDAPGDDAGGMDMMVASSCTAPCLGDAAGDFDGSATGANQRWRYLDDNRDRSWTAMTTGDTAVGAAGNEITTCAQRPTSAACGSLSNALLISSSGASSDPALEYTVASAGVLQLSVRTFIPASGGAHQVRVYRSAREDSLFTLEALPGELAQGTITIDALAGDRLLLALAPTGGGTADVGVQWFISGTATAFPASCLLALDFESSSVTGTTLSNRCSSDAFASMDETNDPDEPIAPSLVAGPFSEAGTAGDFVAGRRLDSTLILDRTGDHTMQFWLKHDAIGNISGNVVLSDMDLDDDDAGGIAVKIFDDAGPTLSVYSCTQGTPTTYVNDTQAWPTPGAWHFVRVVQRGDKVIGCIDGAKALEFDLPAGAAQSSYPLRVGRDSIWNPQAAYFDGQLDDVRFFTGIALPCE